MRKLKLSMSVDKLPAWPDGSRPELLQARICVSNSERGDDITLLSDEVHLFDHCDIVAMLRVFADRLEQKYDLRKEAA